MAEVHQEIKFKTPLEKIKEKMPDEGFVSIDKMDNAVIGFEPGSFRLIYSIKKIYIILTEVEEMSHYEALEHIDYNMIDQFVGEKTPIFCDDIL